MSDLYAIGPGRKASAPAFVPKVTVPMLATVTATLTGADTVGSDIPFVGTDAAWDSTGIVSAIGPGRAEASVAPTGDMAIQSVGETATPTTDTPNYWWTGTKIVPGTNTTGNTPTNPEGSLTVTEPQEGWVPITGDQGWFDATNWWLSSATNALKGLAVGNEGSIQTIQMLKDAGVTFGDPYTPTAATDGGGVEGGEGGLDFTGAEIDTSVASSVWEGYDTQLNQWQGIMEDAMSRMNIDFGDQQTILDALTSQILNYQQPDLTQAFSDMQTIINELHSEEGFEYTADTTEILRIMGLLETAANNQATLDDTQINGLITQLTTLGGQSVTANTVAIERIMGLLETAGNNQVAIDQTLSNRLISALELLSGTPIVVDTTNLASIRDQLLGVVGKRPNIDYTDINRVLGMMEGGPSPEAAMDFVAKSYGFADGTEYMGWLAEQRGLTRGDMQGLSDQEKAQYEKMMRVDIQDQERRAQTQMEAVFADTGSAIRYMAAADEANQQIQNSQMQYSFEMMNQDIALKSQSLAQKMEQYMGMVTQGSMSALQFMDMQQRGYEGLLNGYLSQAQTQLQEFGIGQQGDISALTGAMGAEESRLGFSERSQIANLENQRASLGAALQGAQANEAMQLQAQISNIDNQIQALTSALGGAQYASGLDVEAQRATLENQRASLTAALQGAEATAQMDLQAQIANIDNQLQSLTGALGGAQAAAGMDLEALIASGQLNMDSLTAALSGTQGMAGLRLTASDQDLNALNTQINQVYNSMMVQAGINASILDAVDKAYNTSMKPMMDAINSLLAQENLSAQDEQLAFQYQALAIEETNNYLQFGVGMANAVAKALPW